MTQVIICIIHLHNCFTQTILYNFSPSMQWGPSGHGRQGGKQIISIAEEDREMAIIIALMETLGFYMQYQRPDRDTYVNINFGNIQDGRYIPMTFTCMVFMYFYTILTYKYSYVGLYAYINNFIPILLFFRVSLFAFSSLSTDLQL
jgi:hypothetical protein